MNETPKIPLSPILYCTTFKQDFNATGFFLHSPSYLHEQYLEDFLNLKADRDKVFLGNGLVGGEYTEPVAIV